MQPPDSVSGGCRPSHVCFPVLEGLSLSKSYDGVTVVDKVSISVAAGQIRAVVGENGAGKSTLMSMLTGIVRPDMGEIRVRGKLVELNSPKQAVCAGIAIVPQELQLVPLQSVADNLMLVRPPSSRGLRRGSRAEADFIRTALLRVGLTVDPNTLVCSLSVAECEMLEIARALLLEAQVIIFDEPTAALMPPEAQRLSELIEELRRDGRAILYISHALDEVLRLADAVTVLRDGHKVGDFIRAQLDRETLILAMVDRPVGRYGYARSTVGDRIVLKATSVVTAGAIGFEFELRAGEILGCAGLIGCGVQEAVLALCGEQRITAGRLEIEGMPVKFHSPHDAACAGVVLLPEDRKRAGILPGLSVCENLHVGRYAHHSTLGVVVPRKLRSVASELAKRFHISLASIEQPIATLSGGNQQKVLIARCMQTQPKVLIIVSPTLGVDIGAKQVIHQLILDLAARGTAVVLASPEVEELLALAHRIAVFSQGQMVQLVESSGTTPARILELALGRGGVQCDSQVTRAA